MTASTEIRPQPGPQERFLATPADIAFYGGAAGGGKTWALLLEPLRHIHNPEFTSVTFRRVSPQIRNPGGLWDESAKLYPLVGGQPKPSVLEWHFPSGAWSKFANMQYEETRLQWQGAQIPLICWDELTHFSESQFFYMLSRNRSTSGVRPYVRATTNPDADSWVADFIAWYIGEDGLVIQSRAGVIRWFVRAGDEIRWGDTREELIAQHPKIPPKSFTFIPARLSDNPALVRANPEYEASLLALPYVDRERLLGGNWKIRPTGGTLFNRSWVHEVAMVPDGGAACRFWDFAATEKTVAKDDPDFTASTLIHSTEDHFYIEDVTAAQVGPPEVERRFVATSRRDAERFAKQGARYMVRFEIEPGSAGKREAQRLVRLLAGLDAAGVPSRGDKITRCKPFLAQAEAGNVSIMRASWTEEWLRHMHNQPDAPHDDIWDATGGAFTSLARPKRAARSYQG